MSSSDGQSSRRHSDAGSSTMNSGPRSEPRTPDEDPQVGGALGDGSDVASNEYDGRENRFIGPASTWRAYTADERALSTSIDQLRANDLSIHLYNAHALRARARDPRTVAEVKPWASKRSWTKRHDSRNPLWRPTPEWTAWPLPSRDVPRPEKRFGSTSTADNLEGAYRMEEDWVPSADLRDEIAALILHEAKDRFHVRQSSTPNSEPKPQSPHAASTSDNVDKPWLDGGATEPMPEVLADEDEAYNILAPTVQNIMTHFNDLLIGLHKSRQAHRRDFSGSETQSRSSRSRSRLRSNAITNDTHSGRSSKRRRLDSINQEHISETGDVAGTMTAAETRSRPTSVASKRATSSTTNHPLECRDWSEVLGIASMIGWDEAVVARAAQRCASLFNETMTLRTMPVTSTHTQDDRLVDYKPDVVPSSIFKSDGNTKSLCGTYESLRFCPFDTCARRSEAFEQRWRWREHLSRTHNLSHEQIRTLEESLAATDASDKASANAEDDPRGVAESLAIPSSLMLGGIHRDGFLQRIAVSLGKGRDRTSRRRRSTTAAAITAESTLE